MDYEEVEEVLSNKVVNGSDGELRSLEELAETVTEIISDERKEKSVERPELTEKQEKALVFCLEQTRDSPKQKRYLKTQLLNQGYYKDDYQAKKALKFFLKNDSLPLESKNRKVVNTQ